MFWKTKTKQRKEEICSLPCCRMKFDKAIPIATSQPPYYPVSKEKGPNSMFKTLSRVRILYGLFKILYAQGKKPRNSQVFCLPSPSARPAVTWLHWGESWLCFSPLCAQLPTRRGKMFSLESTTNRFWLIKYNMGDSEQEIVPRSVCSSDNVLGWCLKVTQTCCRVWTVTEPCCLFWMTWFDCTSWEKCREGSVLQSDRPIQWLQCPLSW